MAELNLTGVGKTYAGGVTAVDAVSIDIADGEFIVLVGPSGCGKSTILRMIAGLETISRGEVRIAGRVVNALEPAERDIAMVFQNYALYPHMTVRRNMEYGLRNRGTPRPEIDRRIAAAAETLQITPYLDRKPRALSGGQRQRVAMGRAIVREPAAFLFDEPLSNLDAKLRAQLRTELKDLHRRLGATFIFVTHDQVEAMSLADRIVIMSNGRIEQIGTPSEVYSNPASTFVAAFMGAPPMNLLRGEAAGGRVVLSGGVVMPEAHAPGHAGPLQVGIRPEDVIPDETGALSFEVALIEELGAQRLLHGHVAGQPFSVTLGKDNPAAPGTMRLSVKPGAVRLFDAEAGRRL